MRTRSPSYAPSRSRSSLFAPRTSPDSAELGLQSQLLKDFGYTKLHQVDIAPGSS